MSRCAPFCAVALLLFIYDFAEESHHEVDISVPEVIMFRGVRSSSDMAAINSKLSPHRHTQFLINFFQLGVRLLFDLCGRLFVFHHDADLLSPPTAGD